MKSRTNLFAGIMLDGRLRIGQTDADHSDDGPMGIDLRLEDENGNCLADVGDPRSALDWLLSLGRLDNTVCLRFIDPYGDTVFNRGQLQVLREELRILDDALTDERLNAARQHYVSGARAWPARARTEASRHAESYSLQELKTHLSKVRELVDRALSIGPHHYCRFVGD